eukprot:CAMPEP_0183471990 /NCGR_PEP_ID=MMETSP0370-20130417/158772_1 /TAXON_ID=268820 /ORGANISM="Peridinium aciculiferum, Strain PAER-2" /LENGTH=315 /DNA_ID=CAMNT_0025664603 /DNA_START=38 /DNA_END=982 /DNA_ORIENTATION=+
MALNEEEATALKEENEKLTAALQEEKAGRQKEQQRLKEKIGQKFDQMKAEANSKVVALGQELEEAKKQLEEERSKAAGGHVANGAAAADGQAAEALASAEADAVRLKAEVAKLEERLAEADQQRNAAIQDVVTKARDRCQELMLRNKELEEQGEAVGTLRATLAEEQAQRQTLEAQGAAAKAAEESLREQLKTQESDLSAAQASGGGLQERMQQLESELEDAVKRAKAAEDDFAAAKQALEANASGEAARQLAGQQADSLLASERERNEELQRQLEAAASSAAALQDQLEGTKQQLGESDGAGDAARQELERKFQ